LDTIAADGKRPAFSENSRISPNHISIVLQKTGLFAGTEHALLNNGI